MENKPNRRRTQAHEAHGQVPQQENHAELNQGARPQVLYANHTVNYQQQPQKTQSFRHRIVVVLGSGLFACAICVGAYIISKNFVQNTNLPISKNVFQHQNTLVTEPISTPLVPLSQENTQAPNSTPVATQAPQASEDVFASQTFIDGVDVSGLTLAKAQQAVQQHAVQAKNAFNISVTYQGNKVFSINAGTLNYQINTAPALERAWNERKTNHFETTNFGKMDYVSQISGLDFTQINQLLVQVKSHADMPPKNAEVIGFDASLDSPFQFQQEVYGREVDVDATRAEIESMLSRGMQGNVELKMITTKPEVTVADLQQHYTLLNRSRTSISKDSTEQRIDNIRVAFASINGIRIKPGKQFSFNKTVGPRTLERGYFEAIEYAYGELAYGYGGGVCQASTTIYLAALKSGMKIKKREQHSRPVNYTDPGLDATVYLTKDRDIDFVFENNTNHDIYIVSKVIKDPSNRKRFMAEVSIYGYKDGNVKYELKTEKVEVLPASLDPEYVKDKNAQYVTYTDEEYVASKPKDGFVVETYLLKYVDGNLVDNKTITTDTYKPRPQRVYVGVTPRY